MQFYYRARVKDGAIVDGIMESADRFSLAHELRAIGSTPLAIREKKSFALGSLFSGKHILERVKPDELILFTRNLSGMIKAGLSLARALSVLEKQTKNNLLNNILVSLSNEINGGGTLSTGLAKFPKVFSKLFVSMTKAGEESGNLAGALADIGVNLDKAHAITRKVRGALIYPGVILSAMVVIGILMFAFVVPTLAGTFKELGVKVTQTENFYLEPDREGQPELRMTGEEKAAA